MQFFQEMIGASLQGEGDNMKISPLHSDLINKKSNHVLKVKNTISSVTTRVPFTTLHEYPSDPYISDVVAETGLTVDHIRSSSKLKKLLANVLQRCFLCSSQYQSDQFVMVRRDILMKLLVAQLCVPHLMTVFGMGVSLPELSTFGFDSSYVANGRTDHKNKSHHNQTAEESIESKANNIVVEALSMLKYSEDLISRKKSDSVLDSNRCALFLNLMQFKCTPLLPHSVVVKENAPLTLELLTCHLLSVTAVTTSIRQSIQLVVGRVTNALNDEHHSYAIDERLPNIRHIVLDYFQWLRLHADRLVRLCRKEEVVRSVDSSVRAWLKNESYSSAAELVSVYKQKYRSALTHMNIPLQLYRSEDVDQALKDLVREEICLNKVQFRGGVAVALQSQQRLQQVQTVDAVASSVIEDFLEIEPPRQDQATTQQHPTDSLQLPIVCALRNELCKVLANAFDVVIMDDGEHDCSGHKQYFPSHAPDNHVNSSDAASTSEDESDTDGEMSCDHTADNKHVVAAESQHEQQQQRHNNRATITPMRTVHLDSDWQSHLLDLLYTHTLLAASRTFASGDAFWILSDLYGGEGLTLCPIDSENRTNTVNDAAASTQQRRQSSSYTLESMTRTTTSSARTTESVSAASIAITAAGVKVTLRERYGLYLMSELEACSTDRNSLTPLGRFECTTTTLIVLSPETGFVPFSPLQNQQQQRVFQSDADVCTEDDKLETCYSLYRTVVTNPQQICRRAVTIEPY